MFKFRVCAVVLLIFIGLAMSAADSKSSTDFINSNEKEGKGSCKNIGYEKFDKFKNMMDLYIVNEICELKTKTLEKALTHQSQKIERLGAELEEIKRKLSSQDIISRINDIESKQNVIEQKSDKITSDVVKLEEKFAQTTNNVKRLEEKAGRKKEKPDISFSAHVSTSYANINPGETIKFGRVVTNIGQAYNHSTGIFTAPVNGTYWFFTSILTKSPSTLEVGLRVNNVQKLNIYADSKSLNYNNGVNSVILRLKKGDKVNIVKSGAYGNRPFYIHYVWSTFSGFLINL